MSPVGAQLNQYIDQVTRVGNQLGPIVVQAMILLVIVLLLTKFLGRFFAILLVRFGMPERRATMAVTVLHILVLLLGALIVLNVLGFPGILLFRIILVLVMISLALLIIAKPYIPQLPFKKDDTIQLGKYFGKVEKITFMHTLLRTFDGKTVFVPNHRVLNTELVNLALKPQRRLDIELFISYGSQWKKAQEIVSEILADDERVVEKPAPRVVIDKFTPDYIAMLARFWVPKKYVLTGRWGINQAIMEKFDEEGIAMASPRMEISQSGQAAAPPPEA